MKKFILSIPGPVSDEKRAALVADVAAKLGVDAADLICLVNGVTLAAVDAPEKAAEHAHGRKKASEEK